MMIAIIDYGMGNLRSVENALQHIEAPCCITNQIQTIKDADALILPGVGAFPDCMKALNECGVTNTVIEEVQKGKPLLGICLGMQVLFEQSEEVTQCQGLGLLKGKITLMEDPTVKIPHIGWNQLEIVQEDPLFEGLTSPFVYYVHSYRAVQYDPQDLIGASTYGTLTIPGVFHKDHIWATQFHPEKSGEDGLLMLKNFMRNCK